MKKNILVLLSAVLVSASVASNAYSLCVSARTANVRNGPGTAYEVVWEVYRYMPFEKIGTSLSNEWYAVKDVDGEVSWIHGALVNGAYRCAVVKAEKANVRTGPGTHYRKVAPEGAMKYYSFKVVGKQGAWVKVQDEWNNTGWIHKDLLWIQ